MNDRKDDKGTPRSGRRGAVDHSSDAKEQKQIDDLLRAYEQEQADREEKKSPSPR